MELQKDPGLSALERVDSDTRDNRVLEQPGDLNAAATHGDQRVAAAPKRHRDARTKK
jgi:hypothetical protein